MNDELYPAGSVVIAKGGYIPGTSKGRAQLQYGSSTRITVDLYNGRSETYHEDELRIATEEDLKNYEDRKQRDEEANQRARERDERKRQRMEENAEAQRQAREEEAEAKEEAKRQAQEDYTAEMRKKNARIYGLESLRR